MLPPLPAFVHAAARAVRGRRNAHFPSWRLSELHLGVKRGTPPGPGLTALEWPEAAAKELPQLVLGWRGLLVTSLSDLGNFPKWQRRGQNCSFISSYKLII